MLTQQQVKDYIAENGNARQVIDTLKQMQTEGAEMSIEEMEKRLRGDVSTIEIPQSISETTPQPVYTPQPVEIKSDVEALREFNARNEQRYERPQATDDIFDESPKKGDGGINTGAILAVIVMFICSTIASICFNKMSSGFQYAQQTGDMSAANFSPVLKVVTFVTLAIVLVIFCISQWKLYVKADKPGWAIFIPIYGTWVLFDIIFEKGYLMFILLIPIVNIAFWIYSMIKLGERFEKGVGFKLGLIFLNSYFLTLLGFDDSIYV